MKTNRIEGVGTLIKLSRPKLIRSGGGGREREKRERRGELKEGLLGRACVDQSEVLLEGAETSPLYTMGFVSSHVRITRPAYAAFRNHDSNNYYFCNNYLGQVLVT